MYPPSQNYSVSCVLIQAVGWGVAVMKARKVEAQQNNASANQQARREIRNFLRALDSYADCFSKDPRITFEQHRDGMAEPAKAPAARAAASGR